MSNIPTEMRALVLKAYDADLETAIRNLQIGLRPVPELKPSLAYPSRPPSSLRSSGARA